MDPLTFFSIADEGEGPLAALVRPQTSIAQICRDAFLVAIKVVGLPVSPVAVGGVTVI